ncbi:MAG: 4-(cytidine 5'-diphospho)-2-C-methyl-D-erythritol kinase [Rickettsiales bacterium]|nr:4-(cytidine 5'-diphospho)-2-C-methyl-D-erythritol kinase [Rickettsiales bacterium]
MFTSKCPAKINLFLKLISKRADGFNELESLFAFLDLHDELEVSISKSPKIEITGEFSKILNPQNNLFTKILDFFSDKFGITKNLQIKIAKNIPIGAGLGGGSSDAAYFMKALNEIFKLNLSKEELQKISLNFGSDIAFFFENQASIIRGRGEIITNFPKFKEIPILLINPKIHLSTKDVFKNHDKNFSHKISDLTLQETAVLELIKTLPNDLTKPAISTLPIISEILSEMKNEDAEIAKMSGSGATCFAIFNDENKLENAYKNLVKKFPEFFIKKTAIFSYL